ncbi:hypothetical protein [Candidatus Stoquefichus massiliensis]|uniref:hypothetical protein n=1 Tax=Candidatus Stoquefichus massiliensis TaxID=1470350 RepID=UPI0004822568|nr:hypothetical protein [Candidatus Stoquefichus massiliensis]
MNIELLDDLDLKITRLTKETKKYIEGFNCSNLKINNYLQMDGICCEITTTFIMIDEISSKTIGFLSLYADSVLEDSENGFIQNGSAI